MCEDILSYNRRQLKQAAINWSIRRYRMSRPSLPSIAPRQKILFDFDWRFHRGEAGGAEKPAYGDAGWRKVNLPHDWSIEDIPEGERRPFLRFQQGEWKFAKGDKLAWKQPELDDS